MTREEGLQLFQKAFPDLVMKWTDNRGDWSGKENAIEVFGVEVKARKQFLRDIREIRERVEKHLQVHFLFIFRDRKYLTPQEGA